MIHINFDEETGIRLDNNFSRIPNEETALMVVGILEAIKLELLRKITSKELPRKEDD